MVWPRWLVVFYTQRQLLQQRMPTAHESLPLAIPRSNTTMRRSHAHANDGRKNITRIRRHGQKDYSGREGPPVDPSAGLSSGP